MATDRAELERTAKAARAVLEPVWRRWHAEGGEVVPDIVSRNTCGRTSLFLQRVLRRAGVDAHWRNGVPNGGSDLGFFDGTSWRAHAWVETGGWIVDLTADQFGAPPVLIVPADDRRYRWGGPDTASPEAIARRHRQVEEIWPLWLDAVARS